MDKNSHLYIETISNVVIALTLFLLPVLFLTSTTDFFILPKQVLIISSTVILLLLWGLKSLATKRVVLNVNPLNIPMVIFAVVVMLSAILSVSRFDSLFQAVPILFSILLYFAIVNNISERKSFFFALTALLLGAAVSVVISISYYFNIYLFPVPEIQNQFFNTLGSNVQQAIFLLPLLLFVIFYAVKKGGFPKIEVEKITADKGFIVQLITGAVILAGLLLIAYEIIALPNKPIILPFIYGFQTAFASISQDAQRFLVSLLFGSGYGTFLSDFTRFKLASFNLEQNIWNLNFSFSSSYFLELIATTGILGMLSFLFILFATIRSKASKNPLFVAVMGLFVLSFILPFSFATVTLLFILLGLYISFLNIEGNKKVYDMTLSLVGSKRSVIAFETAETDEHGGKVESPLFASVVFIIILAFTGFFSYHVYNFVNSDIAFAESLRQANQNNGQRTYELQTEAIAQFPQRSDYHRIFSQVNLALANSLAASTPEGASPSAEVQQNVINLLQQSINSARNAAVISPNVSLNWQNLGQIYRSLIGVGENAEQFAIASMNQAIALDPYNPQLYIQLGGIYYQLGDYASAQNQFQVAINLKRDFANAYYNLGHALEEQGDLQNALAAYQIVRQLSADNPDNLAAINQEIEALETRIGEAIAAQQNQENIQAETEQTPLEISESSVTLPEQDPRIPISPPPGDEDEESDEEDEEANDTSAPTTGAGR